MAKPDQPFSVTEPWKFEAITPGQFITFTTPNTLTHRRWLHFPLLRVAVLDSPLASADDESPLIAAMIVPKNRETDWSFCSESGHHQLLFKFQNVSRLILIGNFPPFQGPLVYKPPPVDPMEKQRLENELKPLLTPFHPKASSKNGSPETLFVTDEDDVAYRVTIAKLEGPIVGEFLVEDVELLGHTGRRKQLRRRLRFKRMPKVAQSEALLLPIIPDDEATSQTDLETLRSVESVKFEADTTVLVHEYLIPMVSGLFLIASNLNEQIERGLTPRAFCLGIGGGVLVSFLNTQLGFEVAGVEADKVVLAAAKKHFGFNESGSIRLIIGDAIEVIQNFPPQYTEEDDTDDSKFDCVVPNVKFDVVFVDLDSSEAKIGFSAPPPEFVKRPVFEGLRLLLDDHGVLIMNVVHLNEVFYATLVKEVKEVFLKVYEIDVGNQDNFVVMATTVSPTSSNDDDIDNAFLMKLRSVIPGTFMDSMVEL